MATENCFAALMGLAEYYRQQHPPDYRKCIHCLHTAIKFDPDPNAESHIHLELGNLYLSYTKNVDFAKSHFDKSWRLQQGYCTVNEKGLEAASLLAQLEHQQGQVSNSQKLLRDALTMSSPFPFWHLRLLLQLSQAHLDQREFGRANELLRMAADFSATVGAQYARTLFLVSRAMILLIERKLQEVQSVLITAGTLLDQLQVSQHMQTSLKVYYLLVQVSHLLLMGQVKSVKSSLKQLQQTIQLLSSLDDDVPPSTSNPLDMFTWLPKEHLCVLVYLATVAHALHSGYTDKAYKYTEKAMFQISKLKMFDSNPLLNTFQIALLEHIVMAKLITGNKMGAIQGISQACELCTHNPRLFTAHGAQLHTLLGLYSMSMSCMAAAEAQFNSALCLSQSTELWAFVSLNLAIVYIRTNRQVELMSLLERISPDRFPISSSNLHASSYYVLGLQAFFQTRYHDAKQYLRETLKLSNDEDRNRLTAMSLVLLGHIFLSLGNTQEATNMVMPAMQLSAKIPDLYVQLWASSLLRDVYRMSGEWSREQLEQQNHSAITHKLLKDMMAASHTEEHALIEIDVTVFTYNPQWLDGPPPKISTLQLNSDPSGSDILM